MKTTILSLALMASSFLAFADNNPANNGSATQMKTGNRNATLKEDAAFYNPAGTVFGKDGLALEFSIIPFSSKQSIYDSEMNKSYDSESSSLFYPAFNFVYKKDRWALFGNIGVTNGGGTGNYDDGLPMFERLGIATIAGLVQAGQPLPSNNPFDYTYTSKFEGSAFGIGGSIGGAYRFNDWLSASVGVQYSRQSNHQEGFLDIAIAGNEVGKTEIDMDQTGSNMGFIFGVNVKPSDKLLVAQTFRYYTELELETEINDGKDGGLYVDGSKSLATYVPFYSLGVAYQVSDRLVVEADMNVSFYSMLDLDTDNTGFDAADRYDNGLDLGIAAEYQVSEKLNWGVGFTYAKAKLKEEYMSELEFDSNSLWLNTGVSYQANEKLMFTVGVQLGLFPSDEEVTFDSQLAPGTTYTQTYSKDPAPSLGLGAAYRF